MAALDLSEEGDDGKQVVEESSSQQTVTDQEPAAAAAELPAADLPVFRACKECVFRCLWTQTGAALREQGTFRAKCPFCKADYCHNDVVLLRWPEDIEREEREAAAQRGQRGRRGKRRGNRRR
jgi:hypothetical protein